MGVVITDNGRERIADLEVEGVNAGVPQQVGT
jgi:hypothetical protein